MKISCANPNLWNTWNDRETHLQSILDRWSHDSVAQRQHCHQSVADELCYFKGVIIIIVETKPKGHIHWRFGSGRAMVRRWLVKKFEIQRLASRQPRTYASGLGRRYRLSIYGPKMDRTFGQISRFPSTKGSDISQFCSPFPSVYGSDILTSEYNRVLYDWCRDYKNIATSAGSCEHLGGENRDTHRSCREPTLRYIQKRNL